MRLSFARSTMSGQHFSSLGTMKDMGILIDVGRLQLAVEQLRKGKRRALEEDVRKSDLEELPEPLRKVSRKSTWNDEYSGGKGWAVREERWNEGVLEEKIPEQFVSPKSTWNDEYSGGKSWAVREDGWNEDVFEESIPEQFVSRKSYWNDDYSGGKSWAVRGDRWNEGVLEEKIPERFEHWQTRLAGSSNLRRDFDRGASQVKETNAEGIAYGERMAAYQRLGMSWSDTQNTRVMELMSPSMAMDVRSNPWDHSIKDRGERSGMLEGIRTRIPVHREASAMNTVRLVPVDGIRQQMRESAGFAGGGELSDVEVLDVEEKHSRQLAAHQRQDVSRSVSMQKAQVVELISPSISPSVAAEVGSNAYDYVVKDRGEQLGMLEGIRTRITVHREADVKNRMCPNPVEDIGQQMRASPRYDGGGELSNVEVSDREEKDIEQVAAHWRQCVSRSEKQKTPVVELISPSVAIDVGSNSGSRDYFVKDGGERSGMQEGVRTRITVPCEADMKNTMGLAPTDGIRQQMRESAGNAGGGKLSDVEVSVAAVREALVSSHDTCTEEKVAEQIPAHQRQVVSRSDKQETSVVELMVPLVAIDVGSNPSDHSVEDRADRSGMQEGVRTGITMHHEADVKNTMGLSPVDGMRQQMRESAGYVGGELSNVVAFKEALAHGHDKCIKEKDTEQIAAAELEGLGSSDKQKTPAVESVSPSVAMDGGSNTSDRLDEDIGERSDMQKGIRTGGIMHPEADVENTASLSPIGDIRQQVRESPGCIGGGELSNFEVSDCKGVVKFKEALACNRDPCMEEKDTQQVAAHKRQVASRLGKQKTPMVASLSHSVAVDEGTDPCDHLVKDMKEKDAQQVAAHKRQVASRLGKQKTPMVESMSHSVAVDEGTDPCDHLVKDMEEKDAQQVATHKRQVASRLGKQKTPIVESMPHSGAVDDGIDPCDHLIKDMEEKDTQQVAARKRQVASRLGKQKIPMVDLMSPSVAVDGRSDPCHRLVKAMEEKDTQQVATHKCQVASRVGKQKTPLVGLMSLPVAVDVDSDACDHLVRDRGERSGLQKGVRTGITMHREADGKDRVGPSPVEGIRQQSRDSAGFVGGGESSTVDVSNEKYVVAFKEALASSQGKCKEAKSAVSKQGKSFWPSKVLNQINEGKGARSSLTKKLCGGGTGRWDRDWDIAFWKERSGHLRKTRKEAEDSTEGVEGDAQQLDPEETDSIFSRLYVADTSLLPRDDNVKLLSAPVERLQVLGSEATQIGNVKGSLDEGRGQHDVMDKLGRNGAIPRSKLAEKSGGISVPPKEGCQQGKGPTTAATVKRDASLVGVEGGSAKLSTKSESLVASTTSMPCSRSQLSTSTSDAKGDKRQWARDVLARKMANIANSPGSTKAAEGSTNKGGQYHLLLQLPGEMRPLVPQNRHSKIPNAVRQVQLNNLVEQELRMAKLAVIQNSPECEEAVRRAKAREEELYTKSKSKGVYVNLCVRSLAQTGIEGKVTQDLKSTVSDVIQKALEATGLEEPAPATFSDPQEGHIAVSTDNEVQVASSCGYKVEGSGLVEPLPARFCHPQGGHIAGSKDTEVQVASMGGYKLKTAHENRCVENVLQVGNPDMYGDSKFSQEKGLEASSLSQSRCSELAGTLFIQGADNSTQKMTAVPKAANCVLSAFPEPAELHSNILLDTHLPKEGACDSSASADRLLHSKTEPSRSGDASQIEGENDSFRGLELKVDTGPPSVDSIVSSQDKSEASPVLPTKFQPNFSEASNKRKFTGSTYDGLESPGNGDYLPSQTEAGNNCVDDWMDTDKFADLDCRNTSPSTNKESDVPQSSKICAGTESPSRRDSCTSHLHVQKQVEIYVNQHLKPLYRSGVVTAEEFRYTVSKTATKVMEHHGNASSAHFLITEGSKVKKLADQYLQAFSKRKARRLSPPV